MLVKFAVDYRGQWTNEAFFPAGTIADLPEFFAKMLVQDERATYHTDVASTATEPMAYVDWSTVKGIGGEITDTLHGLGLTTKAALLAYVDNYGLEGLERISGIGKRRAADLVKWAKG